MCRQRDAGEEGGAGSLRVVEGLLHSSIGHADVGTLLEHLCGNADAQIPVIEHTLVVRRSMVVGSSGPVAAGNGLRRNGQQFAKGILSGADGTTGIDDLRLHTQVRRLQLVDSGGVSLTVLIECLLGLERGVPETVGLLEDVELTVEQQEIVVLLCDGADEIGARGLLAQLGLQEHGLRGALLIGDGPEHIDVHRQLQGQRVGLREGALVEAGECALRCEVKRRQIGQLGHLQRGFALLHSDAGGIHIGIVGQHLFDQLL